MPEKIELTELAANYLKKDSRYRSTVFEVYSCSSDLSAIQTDFFAKLTTTGLNLSHPVAFLMGEISGFKAMFFHEFQYVDPEKRFVFFSRPEQLELPQFSHVMFASPTISTDTSSNEKSARESIGLLKAVLLGFFGRGFLLDRVTTFSIEPSGDKSSFFSKVWRTPQEPDNRAYLKPAAFDELSKRIPLQLEPLRSQLLLSCQFMSAAIDEDNEYKRFFDYWTAFEVLCQGSSQTIRSALAESYGQSLEFVDKRLAFGRIADVRHDLIHKGKFESLTADMERIMQATFLDLLRYRLNLACLHVAEQLVSSFQPEG